MSDDILNLQPLHPFKSTNKDISKGIRYSAIDSHSGLLISVADKEIYFYDTNTYEDHSINSKLRRDKSIDFEKSFSINCEFDVSWVEFNCSGSYLFVATTSNSNYLNTIKIIDVAKTLKERKEVAICIFKPNIDSKLVDLKWHPCKTDILLLVLNDSVHICHVKANELVIMHARPNAFCVSWSPKGKQFSVIMQKVESKKFVLNQYDINFVEKRSTEIPNASNDFKVSFDLVPIEICWYATYSVIIGFRGVPNGDEQFKIFVCRFAIKTSKIQVLPDVRSSSDCINRNPGPCARLYYLHIPDWKAIILVNNSAEDAVVFEYDSNDDLHTITTYCLPIEGNVVGLSIDYTSIKTVPESWLPAGFETSASNPLLFLKLSNDDCFGCYLLHSQKKINIYNKMFISSISPEKGDRNKNDNIIQSDVSGERNQNCFLTQPLMNLDNHLEITSQIETPISQINLFVTPNSNNPDPQLNIFGTKNKPTSQSNLFGTPSSDVPSSQGNLFGTKTIDKPTSQSNLFGTPSSDVPSSQGNLFGTKTIDKPTSQSNLFGTPSSDVPSSQGNLFGTKTIDKPTSQSNLFGTPSSDVPSSQGNLFGTKTIDKPTSQSNLFGTPSSDVPSSQGNLFGTKTIDKPTSQSNLFGTKTIDKPTSQSNLFGTPSSDVPSSQGNLFGTKTIDKPTSQSNLFGTPSSDVPSSQGNLFGTKTIDKPTPQSNLFGNTNATFQKSIFSTVTPETSAGQSPLTSISNIDSNSQHVSSFQSRNKSNIQIGNQNKVLTPGIFGASNSDSSYLQSSKSTQQQKNSKLTEIETENPPKSNSSQVSISDTSPGKLPENKISAHNKNSQKFNLEDHNKQNIKSENVATRRSIKISKSKSDTKSDVIDNFLPNAIECLEKQINDIKTNTKHIIDKSKNSLDNGEINKEISKMFHDLEKNFIDVDKINMKNKNIIENSKSLCQDIEITLEFTTRFQEAILDSKINHKHFRSAPNPLLKKTSVNLNELAKKVGFYLQDLEDALDYVESKKDFKIISKNKNAQLQDIKQTLKSNMKVISVERSKLDLIKEHIDDSSSEEIDFHHSHLQARNVNKEMEEYLHALMCRRPVNNISCKLPETKQPIKSKKIISTPPKNNLNASRPANESIKTESKLTTSKPLIVKLVEKDSYKCNQDSKSNNVASTGDVHYSGNVLANKNAGISTFNEIAPKLENLDPIKSTEVKLKPEAFNGDNILKPSSSKDSGFFDVSHAKTVPVTNLTPISSTIATPTIVQSLSDNISQSRNESSQLNASFPSIVPNCSKPVDIIQSNSVIKQTDDLHENSNKTPRSTTATNQLSDITLQPHANIQPSLLFNVAIAEKSSSPSTNPPRVGLSSSAFTLNTSSTGLFNIAPSTKPAQSTAVSVSTTIPQSIFSTPTFTNQKTDLFGNSNLTQPSGVFATSSSTKQNLFGKSNISSSEITSGASQPHGLFATPTSSKQSTALFGNADTPATQTTKPQSIFSSSTSVKPSGTLFGNSGGSTQNSNLFASSLTSSPAPSNGIFTTSESNKLNISASSNTSIQNTNIFTSSTAKPAQSLFSTPISTKTTGLFDNSSGSHQSTGLFGTAIQTASTTKESSGLFNTPISSNNLFGNSTSYTNNTAQPSQSGGLFGSGTNTASGGLFGSPQSTGSTNQSSGGLFGKSNQQGAGIFASSNNVNANTTQPVGIFSGSSTNNQLFGNVNNTPTPASGLFAQSNTNGLFANSKATGQTTGLFGPSSNLSTTSSGLFGSPPTNSSTNEGLFGNKSSTSPSTGIFGKNAPNSGLFNSSNQTNNQLSSNIFGSSLPQNQTNQPLPPNSIFATPPQNQTNQPLPPNSIFATPPQNQTNQPLPPNSIFATPPQNQTNQPLPSNSIFATPSSQKSLFGSSQMGTQQENSKGFSFGGSTMMSGLGSTQSSNNSKNIFGLTSTTGSASAKVNLFAPKTQSNVSNIFNTDAKPNSLFGSSTTSPQSSLFGSRPAFGSGNENSQQTGELFSNSVFGNNSDSQMTFGDMATNNVSQSGFGMNSNQPGNIFQTTTSPSFTQRRM